MGRAVVVPVMCCSVHCVRIITTADVVWRITGGTTMRFGSGPVREKGSLEFLGAKGAGERGPRHINRNQTLLTSRNLCPQQQQSYLPG